jgi:hypothetical protein
MLLLYTWYSTCCQRVVPDGVVLDMSEGCNPAISLLQECDLIVLRACNSGAFFGCEDRRFVLVLNDLNPANTEVHFEDTVLPLEDYRQNRKRVRDDKAWLFSFTPKYTSGWRM